jgi:hypothetical protein
MTFHVSQAEARRIKAKLMNAPVAPGGLAHVINVGTDGMLDVLEQQYFTNELPEGISCFKYLEGDYGTGKTQFIECLADRAHKHHIVTSIVTIDEQCPFSSPLAIFRSVVSSFVPDDDSREGTEKGIEVLLRSWVRGQLTRMGVTPGDAVPDGVRQQVQRPFNTFWMGAPDAQMAAGLQALGKRIVELECGANGSSSDSDLVSWVRGGKVSSTVLKGHGMYESANEANAFGRLKTAIQYLRSYLAYKGVFVAFDEGTRTGSFRRGSVKQRQAIENMLSMINQNAEGDFGGAMFMYAATPDFRTEVIRNYRALVDRIGSVAFTPGQPMTPLIKLDSVNTDAVLEALGERLLEVFEAAGAPPWNRPLQRENLRALVAAQKQRLAFLTTVPPRYFVFHWCQFLESQVMGGERALDSRSALSFVGEHMLPEGEEGA